MLPIIFMKGILLLSSIASATKRITDQEIRRCTYKFGPGPFMVGNKRGKEIKTGAFDQTSPEQARLIKSYRMFLNLILLVTVGSSFRAHATKRAADTEIQKESPREIISLEYSNINPDLLLDNGLELDPSTFCYGVELPFEVLCKISSISTLDYKNLSLVSKAFYLATRRVYYERVRVFLDTAPNAADIFYHKFYNQTCGSSCGNVILRCANWSSDKMPDWMRTLWNMYRNDSMEEAHNLLMGRGRLQGKLTSAMFWSVCKVAASDLPVLYQFYKWFSGKGINVLEGMENLLKILDWDIRTKSVCLVNLLMRHDNCEAVKKMLADSIDIEMWNLVCGWERSSSITEIVKTMKSMAERGDHFEEFIKVSRHHVHVPDEIYAANSFLYTLGHEHFDGWLSHPLFYVEFLLDESFCRKHKFTPEQGAEILNVPRRGCMRAIDMICSKSYCCRSEWAKEVLKLYANKLTAEEYRDNIHTWIVLQHSVYDFESWGSVKTKDAVLLALQTDSLCDLLDRKEIEYILSMPIEDSNPQKIYKWLRYGYRPQRLTKEDSTNQINEAISIGALWRLSDLFLCKPKTVLKSVLKLVDMNAEFDAPGLSLALYALAIMLTENREFRLKHQNSLQKSTLRFCLKHCKLHLTEEQFKKGEQIITQL